MPSTPQERGEVARESAKGRADITLQWLVRLRWGAVAGQVGTVAAALALLRVPLPLDRIAFYISVTALTNVLLTMSPPRQASQALCGAILALDTCTFTGLLMATGGASNPFSVLYLVHINLAAAALGASWAWGLAALSVASYGALFLVDGSVTASMPEASVALPLHLAPRLHLEGMWLAFSVAAVLTAYLVSRLNAEIEQCEAEVRAMRELSANAERLAAMTTLAASAAHELGTPLATIAVATEELERATATLDPKHAFALRADARLIRAELQRCRSILDQMTEGSGGTTGEVPVLVSAHDVTREVLESFTGRGAERVDLRTAGVEARIALPRRAVVRALRNLVQNALDVSRERDRVEFSVDADETHVRFVVRDHGPGMAPQVLARAGEPFFSTKSTGQGMGLGLFLTKTIASQLGGRLLLDSRAGAGVTATFEVSTGRTPV